MMGMDTFTPKHIVTMSTVPPSFHAKEGNKIVQDLLDRGCTLSYHPEFIAQGCIVDNMVKAEIVLIGEGSKAAGDLLEEMNRQTITGNPDAYYARMSVPSSEIMKLSFNCILCTKISYANMIGDICDRTPGADKYTVLKAVGQDKRVGGTKYLMPGYGFGGPCLPRDCRALGAYAKEINVNPIICDAADEMNGYHLDPQTTLLKSNKDCNHYAIYDVAYKHRCPIEIIEESQPMALAERLVKAGMKVTVRDRQLIVDECKKEYGDKFSYEVIDKIPDDLEHGAVRPYTPL